MKTVYNNVECTYDELNFDNFLTNENKLIRQCMWIWTVFAKFHDIKYNPQATQDATNRSIIFTCDNKQYYGKFQTPDITEDLIVDIANCHVIDEYLNMFSERRDFYMQLQGSSLTLLDKDTYEFNLEKFKPSNECDPRTSDIIEELNNNNTSQYKRCKFALFNYIDGTTIEQYLTSSKINLAMLEELCQSLFTELTNINKTTGFCHNDAHIGNIMIRKNKSPVLIDYGKSLFQKDEQKFRVFIH